jgi:hypothetical protein
MSLLPALAAAPRPQILRSKATSRAVANTNGSCRLDGEDAGRDRGQAGGAQMERRREASHIGTEAGAPKWHTTGLQPAFAAQVIGQVMMMGATSHGSHLASAAYRMAAPQIGTGAVFDRGF